jgi:hypothetical protein
VKITVTYEKKDILRLILQDTKAQGIRVKDGTTLAYKGALQVTVQVDTEDADAAETPTPPVTTVEEPTEATEPVEPAPPLTAAEEAVGMGGVLGASKSLVMTQPGKFESKGPRALTRTDLSQEYSEFPEE